MSACFRKSDQPRICCRTSKVIDCFSKCLCLRVSDKKYLKMFNAQSTSTGKKAPTPRVDEDKKLVDFIEREKDQQKAISIRRSRLLCDDFRNQLVRIPLKMRKDTNESFVLSEARKRHRSENQRPLRSVTQWAKDKNFSSSKKSDNFLSSDGGERMSMIEQTKRAGVSQTNIVGEINKYAEYMIRKKILRAQTIRSKTSFQSLERKGSDVNHDSLKSRDERA